MKKVLLFALILSTIGLNQAMNQAPAAPKKQGSAIRRPKTAPSLQAQAIRYLRAMKASGDLQPADYADLPDHLKAQIDANQVLNTVNFRVMRNQ